jgi:hypothetical protein
MCKVGQDLCAVSIRKSDIKQDERNFVGMKKLIEPFRIAGLENGVSMELKVMFQDEGDFRRIIDNNNDFILIQEPAGDLIKRGGFIGEQLYHMWMEKKSGKYSAHNEYHVDVRSRKNGCILLTPLKGV